MSTLRAGDARGRRRGRGQPPRGGPGGDAPRGVAVAAGLDLLAAAAPGRRRRRRRRDDIGEEEEEEDKIGRVLGSLFLLTGWSNWILHRNMKSRVIKDKSISRANPFGPLQFAIPSM